MRLFARFFAIVLALSLAMIISAVASEDNRMVLFEGMYVVGDVVKPGHYDLYFEYDGEIPENASFLEYPYASIGTFLDLDRFYNDYDSRRQINVVAGKRTHVDLVEGMVVKITLSKANELILERQ